MGDKSKLTVEVRLTGPTAEFMKNLEKFLHESILLHKAMGEFEQQVHIPDANCSCHLSPPCGDCVEWGALREARSDLLSALERHTAAAEELGRTPLQERDKAVPEEESRNED